MNLLTCTPTCTPVRRRLFLETDEPLTYGKEVPQRDVAQLGSAPEWGSGGRRFESGRPDLGSAAFCFAVGPLLLRRLSRGGRIQRARGASTRRAP